MKYPFLLIYIINHFIIIKENIIKKSQVIKLLLKTC